MSPIYRAIPGGCSEQNECLFFLYSEQGEVEEMDIGRAASLPLTLKNLLARDTPLEQVLPAFTSNVANILRLRDKGRIRTGNAADVIALDETHDILDVIIAGSGT